MHWLQEAGPDTKGWGRPWNGIILLFSYLQREARSFSLFQCRAEVAFQKRGGWVTLQRLTTKPNNCHKCRSRYHKAHFLLMLRRVFLSGNCRKPLFYFEIQCSFQVERIYQLTYSREVVPVSSLVVTVRFLYLYFLLRSCPFIHEEEH